MRLNCLSFEMIDWSHLQITLGNSECLLYTPKTMIVGNDVSVCYLLIFFKQIGIVTLDSLKEFCFCVKLGIEYLLCFFRVTVFDKFGLFYSFFFL